MSLKSLSSFFSKCTRNVGWINSCVINYVQLTISTQQNGSSAAIKNSKGGQRRDGVGEEEEEEEKRERPKLDLIIARCDKLNFTRKL